ncbi:MAG: DEAD/DEAH box helicase [Spirochaetales bacterium]|nr:DEAD/DEAH box helicase [Spirochaetales bacterium]
MANPSNPLIVQSDRTLLLDVHSPLAEECRNALIPFAELISSPEHLHTYQLTPLSLWNAASADFSAKDAVAVLDQFARYDVPASVKIWIEETASRFGMLRLVPCAPKEEDGKIIDRLYLVAGNQRVYKEINASSVAKKYLSPAVYEETENSVVQLTEDEKKYCFTLLLVDRGTVKQSLLELNWPVKDDVPLAKGEHLEISLKTETAEGKKFDIRDYQKKSADALLGDGGPGTGFGTIVLPCGAGKTVVGMEIMSRLKTKTLILTTNISAVHQWIDELLEKTNLTSQDIAEYTGEEKTIKSVTVATYQILTWRPDKVGPYPHFDLFRKNNWGLVIYDEVHMLPAPVFRVVAEVQAINRVGLTATLVREDGKEGHVFSLVGPKRYDVPWKELEKSKWIASAECIEVRLNFQQEKELDYAVATLREKYRIASENPVKNQIVKDIVEKFSQDKILVIGQYLEQLNILAELLDAPIITGKTKTADRDKIYDDFRNGKIRVLVVSKVANFAINLPDASLAIQVSGTFGSRQEEAQRLGRILRPKERKSRFFTLITRNTVEEEFGSNRQKFLAEQGYAYRIIRWENSESLNELDEELPPEWS